MGLRKQIRDEIERLSKHDIREYKKWETESYLADGATVSKFWDLVDEAEEVVIIGDYDVDGICASYIMAYSIANVYPGKKISIRIPKRFSEGYGIKDSMLEEIKANHKKGKTLVITVDNGISAGDKLEKLENDGYKVALTDHHVLSSEKVPNVSFVLNPSVKGFDVLCGGEYWCGAGVALKLVEQYISEQVKQDVEVFAGIATIADCVPLIKGNWALVRKAIQTIRKGKAPVQINYLISALNQAIKFCDEDTIGYYVGPALNAPGRLMDTGGNTVIDYLIKPSVAKALSLVKINDERKQLRDSQYKIISDIIAEQKLDKNCPIWVEASNLHEGIIGILAGKVVEDYGVPAIVLTEIEEGVLKGSARSTGNIHILDYLLNCGANFISLGGHSGAAGMTITKKEFDIAKEFLIPNPVSENENRNFVEISTEDIPLACDELSKYKPFGEQNPTPQFSVFIDVYSEKTKMVGGNANHLIVEDENRKWKITHFYHEQNELDDKERFYIGGPISMQEFNNIGTPTLNGEIVFNKYESTIRERVK